MPEEGVSHKGIPNDVQKASDKANKLPIKVDNKELAMIAQEQKVERCTNWETNLYSCDFAKYAENCGGFGIGMTEPEKLSYAIKRVFAEDELR